MPAWQSPPIQWHRVRKPLCALQAREPQPHTQEVPLHALAGEIARSPCRCRNCRRGRSHNDRSSLSLGPEVAPARRSRQGERERARRKPVDVQASPADAHSEARQRTSGGGGDITSTGASTAGARCRTYHSWRCPRSTVGGRVGSLTPEAGFPLQAVMRSRREGGRGCMRISRERVEREY